MAQTGVTVSDDLASKYVEFKAAKNKITFLIFKIENKTQIVVDRVSGEGEVFQTFIDALPQNECRFAIYSFEFLTKDGRPTNKLVSISWIPDTASIKEKMLYAGSKDALGRVLVGVSVKINATDMSELTEAIVTENCQKFA